MSKRILLIDSDETFARSLQGSLEGRGLGVQVATNSEQGMALAKSHGPDLIVVCVEAQPTNGYMLCTRLKKDDQLKLVPVVLTSANATADSFEKHKKLKTRAEEYLIKPFEPAALLHRIGALLRIDIPPAPPAEAQEEIVSMEDEPLGLGDLVGEDEPVRLTDSEAAEAHAGTPPPSADLELDSVEVEEVLSEAPLDEHGAASDEDLDMLDAAFDALSPASRPPPATARPEFHDARTQAELQDAQTGPVGLRSEPDYALAAQADPEAHAALEARVQELEEQLAAKDAELEAVKKGQGSAAELRKLKEARSKADKENVRLKEELNEQEKELIELRDQQAALEQQAQMLEDDAVKRELAAKALQQRAEALAAAAKKFERELGAAREELKSVAALKARAAELEKVDGAHQELQKQHAQLRGELELHKEESTELDAENAELGAELAQLKARAAKLEAQLADARAQHEDELGAARALLLRESAELRAALEAQQGEAKRHEEAAKSLAAELDAARAQHAEAASAAEGELASAREAAGSARSEQAESQAAAEKARAELAAMRDEHRKLQDELAGQQLNAEELEGELASAQAAAEKLRGELAAAKTSAQSEVARAHEELEKTQLELAGAQEQLETARAEASALIGEKHLLGDERDELRRQLGELVAASARNEQRAVQAYQRIKGDEKLREKTKKALQIALALLDEVPSLPEEPLADDPPILEQQSA